MKRIIIFLAVMLVLVMAPQNLEAQAVEVATKVLPVVGARFDLGLETDRLNIEEAIGSLLDSGVPDASLTFTLGVYGGHMARFNETVVSVGFHAQVGSFGVHGYWAHKNESEANHRFAGAMGTVSVYSGEKVARTMQGLIPVTTTVSVMAGLHQNGPTGNLGLPGGLNRNSLGLGFKIAKTYGGFGASILFRVSFDGKNPATGNSAVGGVVSLGVTFGK